MSLYESIDSFLICLYRISGNPLLDYYLGTFLLALIAVVVGELTISVVFQINKAHLDRLNAKVEKMSRLSSEALRVGDKESYKACNKEGNDAFGYLFFNKFGLAAASLWPIFLALGWMQERFAEIGLPLPWVGWEINYLVFFLMCYILARIFFGRLKRKLPYFRGMHETLLKYERSATGSEGFTDAKGPSAPPA
jgi:hypothetical protein